MIYVSQIIMLDTLNLVLYVNYISIKLEEKITKKTKQPDIG